MVFVSSRDAAKGSSSRRAENVARRRKKVFVSSRGKRSPTVSSNWVARRYSASIKRGGKQRTHFLCGVDAADATALRAALCRDENAEELKEDAADDDDDDDAAEEPKGGAVPAQ